MMAGPYGTQTPAMPGQAVLGYGPAGQHFNTLNPVAMTTSGLRPLSVASVRVQPHNAAPGTVSRETQMMQANYRPPAWTAQGKALAAREQQVYGGDLYGNPAATGGLGGSGGQSGGQYNSGITAGGISPAQIAQGVATFGFGGQAPGVPTSPDAYRSMQQNYNGLMGQGIGTAALDFARNAAYQSADMNLAQQRARADAGLGWGNLMARLSESNMNGQNQQDAMLQNLLMGLIG